MKVSEEKEEIVELLFGRIKRFKKSGAYLYLPMRLVEDQSFPFKDDDIVKLEVADGRRMIVSIPQWWELLDWNSLPEAFKKLDDETKKKITDAGLLQQTS